MSSNDRQSAWANIPRKLPPFAMRLAIEYGNAAPTRNENDGWIMSCSEQPAHSTCVWLKARKPQNQLPGYAAATRASWTTSAIIRNMTMPRYASIATLRGCGFACGFEVWTTVVDSAVACMLSPPSAAGNRGWTFRRSSLDSIAKGKQTQSMQRIECRSSPPGSCSPGQPGFRLNDCCDIIRPL